MAETSASAGVHRPFSGPPVPSGTDPGSSAGGTASSREAARAALLQLRGSVSSADFQDFVDGVLNASASTDAKEETAASERSEESSASDDNEDMDASSTDGSTVSVRQVVQAVNDQLLATGAGNSGIVSSENSGAVPGNTDSTDWVRVKERKRKKSTDSSKSSTSGVQTSQVKRGRTDSGPLVYLKGDGFDIMKEASRHPLEFSRRLTSIVGPVKEVKLLKDTVRVTCASEKQKTTLLSVTDWFGKPVSVTEPWGKAPVDRRPASLRGIIFGVSVVLTDADVVAETCADSARRVVKWIDGQQIATTSVILTFQAPLPDFVCIGFQRYRVKPFIPQPMRCMKCQRYGHVAGKCRHQVRCVRCGQAHRLDECPVKEDVNKAVCVNCKGAHSAAFRGCSKYQEVSKALRVSVTQKVSYRDALTKVKSDGVLQQTLGTIAEVRPLDTSTPIRAAAPQGPPPPRPAPAPPARRELIQETPDQRAPVEQGTAAAAADDTRQQPRQPSMTLQDFIKQITHHFLYTLHILESLKLSPELNRIRCNLTKLAGYTFGMHGPNPCLTPKCCK